MTEKISAMLLGETRSPSSYLSDSLSRYLRALRASQEGHEAYWPSLHYNEDSLARRTYQVLAMTTNLSVLLSDWRQRAESAKELRQLHRIAADAVSKISAQYLEIEDATLSVSDRGENPRVIDSIATRFYKAREVIGGRSRISCDPGIMGGKPYIRGTRIPLYTILEHAADGYSIKRIIKEFPALTQNDVRDALLFAAIVCAAPWKREEEPRA